MKKAENHFERIRLDIYRYVCDYKKREFAKWQKKYSKYDLQNIHDGEFWKTILDKEALGEKKFFDGRDIESKNSALACSYLRESFEIYDEIKDLISANRDFILKAKFKYQKATVWSQIMGFLLGVGASVLASWVWTCVLKM